MCGCGLLVVVVVAEVAAELVAEPDLPGHPRPALVAVVVEDLDGDVVHGSAEAAGSLQPLVAGDQRQEAALGAAVVLRHDRPPPGEHVPLDLVRARGGSVEHGGQARPVEGLPHLLGKLEHADHLGRHQVHVRDAVGVYQLEGLRGIEAVAHHDRGTGQQGKHREHPLGGVVGRAVEQGHAVTGQRQHAGEAVCDQLHDLGGQAGGGERRTDPLGEAGGAGGVEHRPTHAVALGRVPRRRCQQFLPGPESLRKLGACLCAQHHPRQHAIGPLIGAGLHRNIEEAVVDQHHPGPGVLRYIRELLGHPVPVDGHHGPRPVCGGPEHLEELPAVAGHERDGVVVRQAQPAQHLHRPVYAVVQLGPGGGAVLVDERRPVGLGLGDLRNQFSHERCLAATPNRCPCRWCRSVLRYRPWGVDTAAQKEISRR